MGQSPEGSAVSTENIEGMEFHQGKICFTEKYLKVGNQKTNQITKIASKNSVLLCMRAPVGIVNITEREICIGRGLASVKAKYDVTSEFCFYWLKILKETFEEKATGTTFRAISVDIVKNELIPLPPLMEQYRIVQKLKEIESMLEKIENNL